MNLDEFRESTEHLMGDRENFPLFRKWFPDVPFDDRYKVMAIHIEEALQRIEANASEPRVLPSHLQP